MGWLAGLASWLGSLAVQAGLSGRVVRLGCQAELTKSACGCLAGWLAWPTGWPAWPGLPGLACLASPPPPASPPDATIGATGKLGIGSQTWPEEGAGNAPKGSAQGHHPAQSASYFRVCRLCRLWGEDQQPAQSPSHFRFCRLRRLCVLEEW